MNLLASLDDIESTKQLLMTQSWDQDVSEEIGLGDPDDDEEGTVLLALDDGD